MCAGKNDEAVDLVNMLRSTKDIEEQGDILHYMVDQFGLHFKVGQCLTLK